MNTVAKILLIEYDIVNSFNNRISFFEEIINRSITMYLANIITLNIYSVLLLIVLDIHTSKHSEKESAQHKLYRIMLQTTSLLLIVDILSRFDGNISPYYPAINQIGNFMVSLLSPLLPSMWLLYVHYQLFHEEKPSKWLSYPIVGIFFVNAVLLVLSQFNGWYYYIDSNNIYHRGPLFAVSASFTIGLLFWAMLLLHLHRIKIETKVYNSLLFFIVPPLMSIVFQIVFYGTSLILNSVVLSLLILFLNIQNRSIYVDYLTGVYNRKKLEIFLHEKVAKCQKDKTFSAILIDLNDFKDINDTFGHHIGDDALRTSAKLIKDCIRSNDFLARYGGDEFCAVLEISDKKELDEIVERIQSHIKKYNESGAKPYQIELGMGYAVYDYQSEMAVEDFQRHIDILMYEHKETYKQESELKSLSEFN